MLGGKCFLALRCVFVYLFDINTLGVEGHKRLKCKLDILLFDGYIHCVALLDVVFEYVLVLNIEFNLISLLCTVGHCFLRSRAN